MALSDGASSRPGGRYGIWLLLTLLLTILVAMTWPSTRSYLQAIAVLRQVGGQRVPTIVERLVTEPVAIHDIQFQTAAGLIHAREYIPEHSINAPGLVILHGIHHLGMDEPRLRSFAEAMASCGLRVLTPQLPGIADYHVDATSITVIGGSANWFAEHTGGPVGVLGLSFSGGLALVAASNPAYQPNVKFIFAIGSQYTMDHVANYYLTGTDALPDGTIQRLKPHEYGALVLEYEHMEDFVPQEDEAALRLVLRDHLYEDNRAEALDESRLNAQQRTEATVLLDSHASATLEKLKAANLEHVAEMKSLSPRGVLRTMTTPVYLLHGEADNIIPAAESLWIASELPRTSLKRVLVSPVLSHVDLDGPKPGVWDEFRLLQFFASIMQAAGGR